LLAEKPSAHNHHDSLWWPWCWVDRKAELPVSMQSAELGFHQYKPLSARMMSPDHQTHKRWKIFAVQHKNF
jgi:hypothetical protein